MRYLDDYTIGETLRFGHHVVDEREMLAFARRYDPQPFHLDAAAGAAHPFFGGLAASGWHVCAMAMAMIVANFPEEGNAMLGAAGVDELRWLKPVHAGDVLSLETEVLALKPSATRAGMGSMRLRTTVLRGGDEPVARWVALVLLRTRDG